MHILLLLERLHDIQTDTRPYNGTLRSRRDFSNTDKDPNYLGSGGSSIAKNHPDPHMVKKYNHQVFGGIHGRTDGDGFNKFIEYLIDHDIDNIHFPRVYNVKKIVDKDDGYIHTYTMEKLVNYYADDLTPEQFEAFLEHNVSLPVRRAFHLVRPMKNDGGDKFSRLDLLARMLSTKVSTGDMGGILTEPLREAMTLLSRMGGELDIHGDNLMWRRGGQGMTLVFLDPLF